MKHKPHRGALDPEKYLSAEQLAQLREYARAECRRLGSRRAATDLLLVEVLCLSGLRAGECCNLALRDLPCTHKKLMLEVRDGKGKVSRAVHISQALADQLAEYVSAYRPGAGPEEPLFLGCHEAALRYRTLFEKIKRLGRACGLKLHPHMLRHSYGTWLYGIEHDLVFVRDQLGHANVRTTEKYARTTSAACLRQAEQIR
ncbi:MAG: site-specific integrase [Planctomycetota bacterium]